MTTYTYTDGTLLTGSVSSTRTGADGYFTLGDLTEHLIDWLVGRVPAMKRSVLRRVAIMAFNGLIASHDWPHLRRECRVAAWAPYVTGTVSYDATTRTLTLSDGTWPTWAGSGAVRVGNVEGTVQTRSDSATLIMDEYGGWPEDFEDESYTISPLYYELPDDFQRTAGPVAELYLSGARHASLDEIVRCRRASFTTGEPQLFTLAGHPDQYDRQVLYVWPYASIDSTLDMAYEARARSLRFDGDEVATTAGTVTVSAGGTTVTGSGTAFTSAMVGCVIRFGTSGTRPQSNYSDEAAVEEGVIASVASATSLTLAAATTNASTSVLYTISDPIDLPAPCRAALLRAAEMELGIAVGMQSIDMLKRRADQELRNAMAASSTYKLGGARGGRPIGQSTDIIVFEEAD